MKKDGDLIGRPPKRYGRNLLMVKGALEIACEWMLSRPTGLLDCLQASQSWAAQSSGAIFCRAARPSIHPSIVLGPPGPVSQVRHIGRWIAHQSHHVGKWQAKRETHGTASTAACNERAIVREPDRAKSAWSGTRGIILPSLLIMTPGLTGRNAI